MWHRDLPAGATEMWDVIAKALMLQHGGSVTISAEALRTAAQMWAELQLERDGSITFRVERH